MSRYKTCYPRTAYEVMGALQDKLSQLGMTLNRLEVIGTPGNITVKVNGDTVGTFKGEITDQDLDRIVDSMRRLLW